MELADGRRSNELAKARGCAKYTLVDTNGNRCCITLKNALLAPDFPTSLFSVHAATNAGAKVTFTKSQASLTKENTQFEFLKRGQLYFLPTGADDSSAFGAKTLNEWHITLGHMNNEDILNLQTVTRGMKIED